MKADILRERFLNFFKSKKHKIAESDSLVPRDDPTVLFTPAGMNQFKKEFLGFDSGFKRAATSQRCLRTDDLDKVGRTNVHHTLFEMLGNFSFGDYFKEDAILWAWEFLTKELKIKEEKLWVSVYKDDGEAYKIWKDKVRIPECKIIKLGDKENFWPSEAKEKGPNGPCGPCSEIFFDFGKDTGCGKADCSPACSCGRFSEVWNLVFTQFNRKEGGLLEPLPNKNIDTGMGLERLAAVMQAVKSNFETDLFRPLIKEITSGIKQKELIQKELVWAIADHVRAVVFAIYDGVLPSNESRGYIVRKIIRKSVLHLNSMGVKSPFLYKLVPVVAQMMKVPYSELSERKENIAEIVLAEEKNFISVLNSSEALFKENFSAISVDSPIEAAHAVFTLYDTYGIPLEITQDWVRKHNYKIDQAELNKKIEEQKNRSKLQSAMKGDVFGAKDLTLGIKETKFSGYKEISVKAKVIRIIKDGNEVKKVNKGDDVSIILDKSSFYAESGGQVGDIGELIKGKNIFEVLDTKKNGKVIVHAGRVKEGSFKKNDLLSAVVNLERRLSIARNHTATHLLQAALRNVLGAHVQQQGSLVAEDRLRFDFTHFKGMDKTELSRVEELVNGFIINNFIIEVKQKNLREAKKAGALAFFAEKYDNKVRVVSIDEISSELCGGTHLDYTGQIGLFKIVQEGSVASGVRRIEAATGTFAYKIIREEEDALSDISSVLDVPRQKLLQELEKRNARLKELEKQLNSQKLDSLKDGLDKMIQEAEIIKDIKVILSEQDNLNMDLLRKNVDLIKEKTASAVIALGSKSQDKALLVMGVTEDLCQKGLDASKLIRDVSGFIGGSGGGRKDFAQAGGNKPENFSQAFDKLKEIIRDLK